MKLISSFTRSRGFQKTAKGAISGRALKAFAVCSGLAYGYSRLQSVDQVALMEEDLRLVEACKTEDLMEGQMKEVQVGPDEKNDIVLLAKVDGQVYALGPKCTHLGAPLVRGVLFGDRLYCPYHLASFCVKDGYHDHGPTYRSLPTYKVVIKDGRIFVEVPKIIDSNGRNVPMKKRDPSNNDHYVLVGGGPASLAAAETLRQAGFTGKITLITKESAMPYDRTMLTKMPLKSDEKLEIRKSDFFKDHDIDILNDTEVIKVDFDESLISLNNNSVMKYTKLLLAPGVRPKVPQIDGVNLNGVFTIRELSGIKSIQKYVADNKPKNIVIIGGSFIGAEMASALKLDNPQLNVTILNREKSLYYKALGEKVGAHLTNLISSNGVNVINKTIVKQITGESDKVKEVVLDDGSRIEADFVVLGTGVTYNTDFVGDEVKDSNGAILVNKHFKTSRDNVFAAGDVTALKDFDYASVQHYSEAINQGSYAAWNMVGRNKPYVFAPFFWTRVFNKGLQFVGNPQEFNDLVVKGNMDSNEFISVYCMNDNCHSAAGMGSSKEIITFNQALILGMTFNKNEVKKETFFTDLEGEIRKKGHVCNCTRRATNANKSA